MSRKARRKLPADPDGKNDKRAEWSQAAIMTYRDATGTDSDDALLDLLCDLMHWADRRGGADYFDSQLERARHHYAAETGQPGPLSD